MSRLGIDYAWQHPSLPAGCTFVARYLSNDASKNLTRAEADSLRSQGQDIVVVWETTTNEVDGGHDVGVSSAHKAETQATAAGALAGSPIYFAVDYDAQIGPIISGYFQGVAEVLGGVARVGVYGGYHVVSALKDAGFVNYIWQTSAWSGGAWHPGAHIQQYGYNDIYDWNRTSVTDFGQWRTEALAPVDMHPGARMIKIGDSGPDVASLQAALGVATDGSFGPATDAAVRAFQVEAGLGADGFVGAETWKAVVIGDIGIKWRALGGAVGPVGRPQMIETGCPDGKGRFVHFDGGSIYWTPETGAVYVHGAIRDKWQAIGWETSFVGYPVTDEASCADGAGRFSQFQHGAIYWSPTSIASVICGDIQVHWQSLGAETGILGYPTTDETGCPDGKGRYSDFEHGVVYWAPETGAHEVHGLILKAWAAEKWETGLLGYPVSDEHADAAGHRVSTFQGADILCRDDGVYISRQIAIP